MKRFVKRNRDRLKGMLTHLHNRLVPGIPILMYHRIAEADTDPWGLCVSSRHFAQHLEVLRHYSCPISLSQLLQAHQQGRLPRRAVVVTFDDGYANNLYTAKPLLEQYDIPATVFVTTSPLRQHGEFWWDELERLLLHPGTLPETLRLYIQGQEFQWDLGTGALYSEAAYRLAIGLRAWEGQASSRLALYHALWQRLQPLVEHERQLILDNVRSWAGAEAFVRPALRPLLPEELYALDQVQLVDIGSHTITHPFLPDHPITFQRQELQQSKDDLEQLLGHAITHFAYPHGGYTMQTLSLVRAAGYACACTTVGSLVQRQTGPLQFPRLQVEDCNGGVFSRWLLGNGFLSR